MTTDKTPRGTGRAARRPGINPEETYQALGPITEAELPYLNSMSPGERNRWISNIYGPATSAYARVQYTRLTRNQQP